MLDVHRLRALLAVREHGGLQGAAYALSLPPAELAEQVNALERQVALALLDGDPRGSRLTPAGHQLAERAQRVLGELEAAQAELSALTGRVAGRLRLGVSPAAARALLPDALARLWDTAPDLDVRVEQLGTDEGLGSVASGALDAALVGEYGLVPWRLDAVLERRDLMVEPVLVAVPVRHPAAGPTVRLAELAGDRWVGAPADSPAAELLRRGAGVAGMLPRVVAESADDALSLALVGAGVGLALVPASAVDQHGGPDRRLDGVRLLMPVDPSLRRTVAVVSRRSASGDPATGRLLDALVAAGRRFVDVTPGATRPTPSGLGADGVPSLAAGDRNGHPAILPPPLTPHEHDIARGGAAGPVRGPADLPRRPAGQADPHPAPAAGPARRHGPADLPPGPADLPRRRAAEVGAPPPGPADIPRRPPDLPEIGPAPGDAPGRAAPDHLAARRRPDPHRPLRPAAPSPPGDRPTSSDLGAGPLPAAELPRRSAAGPVRRPAAEVPAPPAARPPGGRPRGGAPVSPGSAGGPGQLDPALMGTLPPAPHDEDVRLSIFEELRSEWFNRRPARADDLLGGPLEPAPWDSPADEGWRAAARLTNPTTAGTTTAGLPKRVPQAQYVPGAVGDMPRTNGTPNRSPQEVRGRLSSYREGVRRGRHAERPGEDPAH